MSRYLLALVFGASAVASAMVVIVSWRRRHTTMAVRALMIGACGTAAWAVTDTVGVLGNDAQRVLMFKASFVGVCAVVIGVVTIFLAVIDRSWRLSRRTLLLLLIEPVLLLAAIATDPWHHLCFPPGLEHGLLGIAAPRFGPLLWVHIAYANFMTTFAAIRAIVAWRHAQRTHRRVLGVTLLAVAPSFVANLAITLFPDHMVDVTVVTFAVWACTTLWGLAHRWFTELIPVARQRVLEAIEDAVTVVDPQGRILDLNAAADQLLRRLVPAVPAVLIGRPVSDIIGDRPLTGAEYAINDAAGTGLDLNVRIRSLDDEQERHLGWTLMARDVTELNRRRHDLEQANEQVREKLEIIELLRADLAEQAARDALTGLHNRRYLVDALATELARAGETGAPLSVVLLDIDHFKRINDTYGHSVGDDVLCHMAPLLTGSVARDDIVARHGGEEFVLVLRDATVDQARARMDGTRERLALAPVRTAGHVIPVTFSAGIAAFTGVETSADLLQFADEALYAAKRNGRDRVEVAPPAGSRATAAA